MLCSRCNKRMAVIFTSRMEGEKRINEGYCLACAKELKLAPVDDLLKQFGISDQELEHMEDQLMQFTESNEFDGDFDLGGTQADNMMQRFMQNMNRISPSSEKQEEKEGEPDKKKKKKEKKEEPEYKFLAAFCEDLNKKAKEGRMDLIVGRDREIERVIQILNRRQKNNPCLIGEPGVGKTAIAEGIAQRIVAGNVPFRLKDKEVHLLDLAALVAGTQFRGQFESRMKGLISDVKRAGNIILFIDEVHTIVGTGDSEGSMNAANLLKPALSRGEVQLIGATTFDEYRKYIEKDSALERRFQPVTVEEPSEEDTIRVLQGIKRYYEDFHRVQVPDSLVASAVHLSERYITDRFLPDKAIDMLDEACSCAALDNQNLSSYDRVCMELEQVQKELEELTGESENPDWEKQANCKTRLSRLQEEKDALEPLALHQPVTYDHLAKVIELWTGIPASSVKESELTRIARLEEILSEKIVGQKEAIRLVSDAIRRTRVRLTPEIRPASFLFVGPTGVGKTELVKVLSRTLFDSTEPMIRLDMSEFMEKHTVARLIGSPPGYVGYDDAGQLTEKVRRKPYSVVLFDEIEKAHPDVLNILLQILDEGKVKDAHGRTVSFRNTVIVMTSNAGSSEKSFVVGFDKSREDQSKEKSMRALKNFLRPEFIARIDEIVHFHPLTEENFREIARMQLNELAEGMKLRGMELVFDAAASDRIAQIAFKGGYGARDIRRTIRREVEDPISRLVVDQGENPPKKVVLSATEENLTVAAVPVI